MFALPSVAVGAVAAALIAGLVSLLGLIVSKEQKVSEFHQAWIDALRVEIAALIAHANAIHGVASANFPSGPEAYNAVKSDLFGINQAAAKIRLRLSLSETEDVAVLEQIKALEELFKHGPPRDWEPINAVENKLVAVAHDPIEKKWRQVQDGEPVYRSARITALSVSAACIVALLAISVARIADL